MKYFLPGRRRPYLAALEHYDLGRDPETGKREQRLPADPGTVHAYLPLFRPIYGGPRTPQFATAPSRYLPDATCDTRVRVILPTHFDPDDPDACTTCAHHVRIHGRPDTAYHDRRAA